MNMIRGYPGSVAVITGAANGLGKALAKQLARLNCGLALVDIDPFSLANAGRELAGSGVVATCHVADVSSPQDLQRAAQEVRDAHGTVNLLINNAGISASAFFENTNAMDFERLIQVNFLGLVQSCRIFLPFLREHAEGQILNTASCFAWHGYPRKTAYASSKAAIRAFSESLRCEIASDGIGVTVLYPGPLFTSLVGTGLSDSQEKRQREEKFLQDRGIALDHVARLSLNRLLKNPCRIVIGLEALP